MLGFVGWLFGGMGSKPLFGDFIAPAVRLELTITPSQIELYFTLCGGGGFTVKLAGF
jgi:hypothetical protein